MSQQLICGLVLLVNLTKQNKGINMKLNYTKATKEHIVQMAVRKKYLAKFNKKLNKLSQQFTEFAEKEGDHTELSLLPVHLRGNFNYTDSVSNYGGKIFDIENCIALQSQCSIRRIKLTKDIFVLHNSLTHLIKDHSELIINFQKFLKEVDQFAVDVSIAVNTYTTYQKALNAIPWIEWLHPDKDTTVACNVVPIDTINKVNEMMGLL